MLIVLLYLLKPSNNCQVLFSLIYQDSKTSDISYQINLYILSCSKGYLKLLSN